MEVKLYSIGQLSKATGMPVTTIRKYSDLGLLSPRRIDAETGYRYYDENQFWQLELIRFCRDVGMPYPDIKKIISGADIEQASASIKEKLFSDMVEILNQMKALDALQEQWMRRSSPLSIEKTLESFPKRTVPFVMSDDPDGLHAALLAVCNSSKKHLQLQFTTGYIFDPRAFESGNVRLIGEFFNLDPTGTDIPQEHIMELPAGKYLCCNGAILKDAAFADELREYLRANNMHPSLVIAEELYMPIMDWKTIDYRVQILIEKE